MTDDEKLEAKIQRIASKAGPEALQELRLFYNENKDRLHALTDDNPEYEETLPWLVTLQAEILATGEAFVQVNPQIGFQAFGKLCAITEAMNAVARAQFYKGYQQGKQLAVLNTWAVAEEESCG